MPGGMLHHPLAARPSRSLAVRGGLAHTFGSLAGFLVVSFLCWGNYILEDAFANPLDAGAAATISAGFLIAVGVIQIFYLIKPGMELRATPICGIIWPTSAFMSIPSAFGNERAGRFTRGEWRESSAPPG